MGSDTLAGIPVGPELRKRELRRGTRWVVHQGAVTLLGHTISLEQWMGPGPCSPRTMRTESDHCPTATRLSGSWGASCRSGVKVQSGGRPGLMGLETGLCRLTEGSTIPAEWPQGPDTAFLP